MRVGILTGGGDCPGLNAVLRGFVLTHVGRHGHTAIGFERGWKGVVENRARPLLPDDVADQWNTGGTLLGTSRTNPLKSEGGFAAVRATWQAQELDALVAIGGEDTLGVATRLAADGLALVGVPKTIDNDLSATDYTFGFDTAVNIATEAIDRLHTTARSHGRVLVCEVMGRHAGWIALHAGIAGGAHAILLPEFEVDFERVAGIVRARRERGSYSVVVVSEGVSLSDAGMSTVAQDKDAFGHVRLGGVGERLAQRLEEATGAEVRSVVLGHIQRGGSPSAFDRVLATRFGVRAAEVVHAREWGNMVALRGTEIVTVPLAAATGELKTVPASWRSWLEALEG